MAHAVSIVPGGATGLVPLKGQVTEAGAVALGSPAKVYALVLYNDAAAAAWFKLYDKVAGPTVGTDVPVMTIGVPTKASVTVPLVQGVPFANGIGWAATAAAADNSTAAATVTANVLYAK